MNYFPMFTDLADREVLIFGGGKHALEKIERLLPFSPKIRVISDSIIPEIGAIQEIKTENRDFSEDDLNSHPVFVITAGDREHDERIAAACHAQCIPVNAVDRQDLCDFIFPSIIATDKLCIGVSTGGASPAAAVRLKKDISEIIPDSIDSILDWMPDAREYVRTKENDHTMQVKILHAIVAKAFEFDRKLSYAEVDGIIEDIKNRFQ